MTNGKFNETYRLKVSDYTQYDTIAPHAVLDIFQDIAGKHCVNYNMAFEDLIKNNQIWVLLKVKYQIVKPVKFYALIKATTWPKKQKLVEFDRDFLLYDENSDLVIKGSSQWVIIDSITRKIIPAKKIDFNPIICNEDAFEDNKFSKLLNFDTTNMECYNQKALFMDLDHNGHVNNIKYCVYILNALKLKHEEEIKEFEINFINELHYNETISIFYLKDNSVYNIKGTCNEKTIFLAKIIVNE